MLSCIQECAPPGPQVGSISFDFVTKSDGMALVRQGHRQPHWSNCSDASLAIQDWIDQLGIANRISRHAFDWQTKGSAGYVRGLNSAWRPDVNGLAIQTQMAQRPRHQCQDLSQLRLLCKSLCNTTVDKNCSVLKGSLKPGLPRLDQGMLTRGVKAVRILPTTIEA